MHPNRNEHHRILLGPRASEALTAAGQDVFLVLGRASHPDDPARWAIHAVPIDKALADQLCEIAMGTRKPGPRVKTPPTPEKPALVAPESNQTPSAP